MISFKKRKIEPVVLNQREIGSLVQVLKEAGYYPDDLDAPDCLNEDVLTSLNLLTCSSSGKGVAKVIEILKLILPDYYGCINPNDFAKRRFNIITKGFIRRVRFF